LKKHRQEEIKMDRRIPLLLLLAPLAAACFQEIDNGATRDALNQTPPVEVGDGAPTTHIETPDPSAITFDGSVVTASVGCEATTAQATDILTNSCAFCHTASNIGNFSTILDVNAMINAPVATPSYIDPTTNKAYSYVVPGQPDRSFIYVRMARGDMPQAITDPRTAQYRIPTISDKSVIHEWIQNCIGSPAPAAQ
jgi:hypothetical protein